MRLGVLAGKTASQLLVAPSHVLRQHRSFGAPSTLLPRITPQMEEGHPARSPPSQAFDVGTLPGLQRWKFGEKKKKKSSLKQNKAELFVMLPLGIVAVGEVEDGKEVSFLHSPSHRAADLDHQFAALKEAGIDGVMMDVWWGIVERAGPQQYDFAAYIQLFKKARKHGLKVQAVMSFHAGGGNVGDGATNIPLPEWVLQAGEALDDEIFYTDKGGSRDHEYLSLGVDHLPVLAGRTPVQCYRDFVARFKEEVVKADMWGNTVVEICMGVGPCGELRYPAYQEAPNKWSYMGRGEIQQTGIPGVGEFQCYDKYMMEDLKQKAIQIGRPEWGVPPGIGAGVYSSAPWETSFLALTEGAGWQSDYGRFFLTWYSERLIKHGADILDSILPVLGFPPTETANTLDLNNDGKVDWEDFKIALQNRPVQEFKPIVDVAVKVSGIHWWWNSPSHAAEMTAGYYNYMGHCGYEPIARMLKYRRCGLSFTCIEMSDTDNPEYRQASPEGLVRQMVGVCEKVGVPLLGENALEGGIYNQQALDKMLSNATFFQRITLLRLSPNMFEGDDDAPSGQRVKDPLNSFIRSCRDTHVPVTAAPADAAGSSNGASATKVPASATA